MTIKTVTEPECCPEFDPAPWNDRIIEWEQKKFITDKVCTFLYIPLNMGAAMRRIDKKIRAAGAVLQDFLCLSDHTSKWNMNLYAAVDREIPGAEVTTLSGRFYSRVYDGDFKNTGKWCADFEKQAKDKGFSVKKWYMWYTTCPKCAKKYGHNYVVIISEIDGSAAA